MSMNRLKPSVRQALNVIKSLWVSNALFRNNSSPWRLMLQDFSSRVS
jgi:hypothetical protein